MSGDISFRNKQYIYRYIIITHMMLHLICVTSASTPYQANLLPLTNANSFFARISAPPTEPWAVVVDIWEPLEGEWSTPEGAWRDRGGRVSTGGDPFAFQSPSNGPPMAIQWPQWPSNGLPMAMWGSLEGEWSTPEGAWRVRGEVPGYMVHIVAWGAPPGMRCLVTWSTLG